MATDHQFVIVDREMLTLASGILETFTDAIEHGTVVTASLEMRDEMIGMLCKMQALILLELDQDEVRWEALKEGIGNGLREAMLGD